MKNIITEKRLKSFINKWSEGCFYTQLYVSCEDCPCNKVALETIEDGTTIQWTICELLERMEDVIKL
jgi:hypothetical protein